MESVVNPAGDHAAGPHKTFEMLTASHFALTFGVNVEAAFHLF